MDPLSDVMRVVRLDGAFFYNVEASGPWSIASVAAKQLAPRILPDSEHLIAYHVLVAGTCWAGLTREQQTRMDAGDVIVFPHGDPHVLSSHQGGLAPPELHEASPQRFPQTLLIGEGRPETAFVCGFLGCDARPFNPLLQALPSALHVRGGAADGWLSEFPRQVVAESQRGRVGADTMLTRMAELMFIEIVRRHLESLPADRAGWIAGLRDPIVGPALTCMHAQPARPWTVADLAREAAASRTVLAERFATVIGMPPVAYLTHWRLQLAARLLTRSGSKIAAIAAEVGYESEAAFSRAFKRTMGTAPAEYRRSRLAAMV